MLCQKISHLLVALLTLSTFPGALAQFEDASAQLGVLPPVPTSYNGNGISFADFNNDGWDDLTFGRGIQSPVFYENVNGQLAPASFSIPNNNQKQIHALLWADYDNDGDNDLLITKEMGPIELWRNNGDFSFTNVASNVGLEQINLMYNGAAFADFDHDGDLDLYIAKFYHPTLNLADNKRNVFYRNNGDGSFTDITEEAGVMLGQRPCFQPLFLDYNNDGWEDLYLITDRVFVENALFINNHDGTFTNVTAESGAGIMICSMTGSVSDFDRDADLDVFISNGPSVGSKLIRNNGNGTFTEAADDYGLNILQLGWGGAWLDYDNDGWDDLFMGLTNNGLIPFTGNHFYRNNSGGVFSDVSADMGTGNMLETYVCAKADYDHDGRYDLMTNNDADHSPRLFRNITPAGNFISIDLEGVVSNGKGIGCWISCHMSETALHKQKLCGENLNAQEGDRIVFGLGENTVVDSLVVQWNSGIRDVYYNLPVGEHIHAIEGHSAYYNLALTPSVSEVCPGDSVTFSVGDFASYEWSNGETTPEITVWEGGSYSVTVTTEAGYSFTSQPIVLNYPAVPQFASTIVHQQCYGMADASIEITVNGAAEGFLLLDGVESTGLVENLLPGFHNFSFTDGFGCAYHDSVEVLEAQPIVPFVAVNDVMCHGGNTGAASVLAFGGAAPYTYDWQGSDPEALHAGLHSVAVMDANGCTVNVPVIVEEPEEIDLEVLVSNATELGGGYAVVNAVGGTPPYSYAWSSGDGNLDFAGDLVPGNHTVTVTDANGCWQVASFEVLMTVDIREAQNTTLRIYPNPVIDALHIAGCDGREPLLRVHTLSGHTVLEQHGSVVDVSQLAAGHYLAVIACESIIRVPFVKFR